ncbi:MULTISPECIES: M66 family metalloprotease [unclassified Nocardioides]|uniref:M66 family metalloprotease n=1 Tax=unclassified Nocardioides TaxID=2615069 RepID=UPI000701F20C|nr:MULTISPECIES: M66 family metalloprotease [unclassified Nocardioides]KRA37834.1 hypothetical protein ASD81_03850 [Nocardioides sp. Root614]KRA91794.1 hypothetical protein ASD84_04115 [Nocardioides sp. Root682]
MTVALGASLGTGLASSYGATGADRVTAGAAPAVATGDERYDTPAQLGFHDTTATGSVRALRNDLTGALAGQVEFVQSHSVNPSGNAAREMPTVVARRAALLLFSPLAATDGVTVVARRNGLILGTLRMAHPNALPQGDLPAPNGRKTVQYSLRAWSVALPQNWVLPGLELSFTNSSGSVGTLAASGLEIAAPTELVINNIRLGMLTDAPVSNGHGMLLRPAETGTDYFQTIPVSKLTIAKYDTVRLDKVIVASGKVYETPGTSDGTGGVYDGDMRENVAKAQVATGINLANFGIPSALMNQRQPGTFNERIIHHAAGNYTNGVQGHGLSGGNGMATLYDSVGNELSHELGHSYGLGHYPGMDSSKTGDAKVINAVHHSESGWGWIAYRNRMRSNFMLKDFKPEGYNIDGNGVFSQTFAGQYNYGTDAMSGGWGSSKMSQYTHHTGYSAKRIQAGLRTVVPDPSYPSGYRDWDATKGVYVDAKVKDPTFNPPAKPVKAGIPVFTFLGGYNPANTAQTVLYPAFRSNYGNTFNLPAPTKTSGTRECWLDITLNGGQHREVLLDSTDGVKQLNVNVAQSDRPTNASIQCRNTSLTTQLGNAIVVPTNLPAMDPAVVIGQDAGFEALRKVELAQLTPVLEGLAGASTPVLSATDMLKLMSWQDNLGALSATARTVANRVLDQRARVTTVNRYLNRYATALAAGNYARKRDLKRLLKDNGFVEPSGTVFPAGGKVLVESKCLHLDKATTTPEAWVTPTPAGCADTAAFRWFVDARGALHSQVRPDQCMAAGSPVAMASCDASSSEQEWVLKDDGHVVRRSDPNSAMDLYRATNRPGMYGYVATGSNQMWKTFPVSTNPLLVLMDAAGLRTLAALDLDHLADVKAPALTLSTQQSSNGGGLCPGPLSVTPRATDDSGDPVKTEIRVNNGKWTPYSTPARVVGTTAVAVRGTDSSGNVSAPVTRTFRPDNTPPLTKAVLNRTTHRVTLTATDAQSGVVRIQQRLGRSRTWTRYSAPIRVSATDTVHYRAIDAAGLVEVAQTLKVSASRRTSTTVVRARTCVQAGERLGLHIDVRGVRAVSGKVKIRVERIGGSGSVFVTTSTVTRGSNASSGTAVAVVPGSRLRAGTYRVKVVYSGNARVNRSSGSLRFTVR